VEGGTSVPPNTSTTANAAAVAPTTVVLSVFHWPSRAVSAASACDVGPGGGGDNDLSQLQQARAAPHPHDAHTTLTHAVNNAEGRVDDLAQRSDAKLRNDPPALWELGEALDLRHDLAQQALANVGNIQLRIPRANVLEIRDRRVGGAYRVSGRHVRSDSAGA